MPLARPLFLETRVRKLLRGLFGDPLRRRGRTSPRHGPDRLSEKNRTINMKIVLIFQSWLTYY